MVSYEEIRNFPRPITVDEEIKFAELLKVRNFRRRYPMEEIHKASSWHPLFPHLGSDPVIVVAPMICFRRRCERTHASHRQHICRRRFFLSKPAFRPIFLCPGRCPSSALYFVLQYDSTLYEQCLNTVVSPCECTAAGGSCVVPSVFICLQHA